MEVGPSMCGKSYFVRQMLEGDHIEYEDPRKQRRIHWFYGQYQDMFKDMRRNMGKDIYFKQGLPKFELILTFSLRLYLILDCGLEVIRS